MKNFVPVGKNYLCYNFTNIRKTFIPSNFRTFKTVIQSPPPKKKSTLKHFKKYGFVENEYE